MYTQKQNENAVRHERREKRNRGHIEQLGDTGKEIRICREPLLKTKPNSTTKKNIDNIPFS